MRNPWWMGQGRVKALSGGKEVILSDGERSCRRAMWKRSHAAQFASRCGDVWRARWVKMD